MVGLGTVGLAGCLDGGPGDEGPQDTDGGSNGDSDRSLDDVDPALRVNDRALSSAFPVELLDPDTGDVVANVHWHGEYSHWHFAPLEVPYDERRSLQVRVVDHDRDEIPLGEDQAYRVTVHRTEQTPEDLLEIEVDGETLEVYGTTRGEGKLLVRLWYDDEDVWLSPPLPTNVGPD